MSLLLLFGGSGVTIDAPMATATGAGLTPTLKLDRVITAPMGAATGVAFEPSIVAGGDVLVSAPMATASGAALTPSVVTQAIVTGVMATAVADALAVRLDTTVTAPMATATGVALPNHFDVTITAPMAEARGQAVPSLGVERARLLGTRTVRPRRHSALGTIVHVFTSPDGDSDIALVGDWSAEEEDLGGYMSAAGTLPASVVEAHPNIYRYGSRWRSFHVQTRKLIWSGRIKKPRREHGQYTLDGLGWGQVFGDKRIEYLLYQSVGTEGWQAGMAEPWVKETLDGLQPNYGNGTSNWETNIQDDMIEFKRTVKFDSGSNNGDSLMAVFYAPNLPPGESLTRLAFTLNVVGDTQGFSPAGSSGYYGVDHPNRSLRTNVQDDIWTSPAGSGLTRAMGPVAPHIEIHVGYLNEETGQIHNYGDVAHIHANGDGYDSKWDIGLLDVWTSGYAHDNNSTPGSSAGGWAAVPSPLVDAALTFDPGGAYTVESDGGLYPWNGQIPDVRTHEVLPRVNIIMIQASHGHSSLDASTFKWADDQSSGVAIHLRDIRVNALAEGDNMTAGQLVQDVASRTGLPEDYIDGGGWNILPYKIEQGKVAEAWEYASLISNRRARTTDYGARPILEFGRYADKVWTIDDERQDLLPIELDQYDRVRVRYQLHAATTSVKVRADPDPLPWYNEYETIDLPTPLRSQDRAEQFADEILEDLVIPRTGGDGRITDVLTENGARRSAHFVRAGDVARHSPTRSPRMRVQKVRHTYDDVEVTFPDSPVAVDRLIARREERIADGRKWHRS